MLRAHTHSIYHVFYVVSFAYLLAGMLFDCMQLLNQQQIMRCLFFNIFYFFVLSPSFFVLLSTALFYLVVYCVCGCACYFLL